MTHFHHRPARRKRCELPTGDGLIHCGQLLMEMARSCELRSRDGLIHLLELLKLGAGIAKGKEKL